MTIIQSPRRSQNKYFSTTPAQQYNSQETEKKPQNDNCHLKRLWNWKHWRRLLYWIRIPRHMADNTCELCDVMIDMSHNDKYRLTIKPVCPGAWSYDGDWGRANFNRNPYRYHPTINRITGPTFENFVNRGYFWQIWTSQGSRTYASKDVKYHFWRTR